MNDPIVDGIESAVRELFSSNAKSSASADSTPRQGVDPQKFFPVAPAVIVLIVVVHLTNTWPSPPPIAAQILHSPAVQWLVDHQPLMITAAGALVAVDILRWNAYRHRIAVRRMVYQTTMQEPKQVRVSWWTMPGSLDQARVKLVRGTVITDKRLADLKTAIAHANNRKGKWDYTLTHDGARDRLTIARRASELNLRSERHRRLQAVLDARPILSEAKVAVEATTTPPATSTRRFLRRNIAATPAENSAETAYRITFTPDVKMGAETYQRQVGDALIALAGEHESGHIWTIDWRADLGYLLLSLKTPLPTRVNHPIPDKLTKGERLHVPYATGEGGVQAVWDISNSSSSPHMLVIGPTGGGKTTLILSVITELILREIPVIGVDPKRIELDGLHDYPGVAAVVIDPLRAAKLVRALCAEMYARLEYVRINKIESKDLPEIAVVLDEFFILSAAWQQLLKTGDKSTVELLKELNPLGAIADLGALCRSANIRLCIGIQRPDASVFGSGSGSVRDNFKTRASLARLSQDGAMMLWGDAHVGRDVDSSIPGRAVVTDRSGDPMDAQVWWTPNLDRHPKKWNRMSAEDQQLVEQLTPHQAPEVACYSEELAEVLLDEQRHAAETNTAVAEPTMIGGRKLVADTDGVDELPDAVPAAELTEGTEIQITDDSGDSSYITVVVLSVTATAKGVDVRCQIPGTRQTVVERYRPTECVFLATPDDQTSGHGTGADALPR